MTNRFLLFLYWCCWVTCAFSVFLLTWFKVVCGCCCYLTVLSHSCTACSAVSEVTCCMPHVRVTCCMYDVCCLFSVLCKATWFLTCDATCHVTCYGKCDVTYCIMLHVTSACVLWGSRENKQQLQCFNGCFWCLATCLLLFVIVSSVIAVVFAH